MTDRAAYDAIVVGGGHNGLVASAYLARAGMEVLTLERLDDVGGAAVSQRPFAGVDASLSRYAYLVSLFPDRIRDDLGLDFELRSRPVSSYTPVWRDGTARGLLVEREPGAATIASFAELTGGETSWVAWQEFYARLAELAAMLAPTLTEPLPSATDVRRRDPELFDALTTAPLGQLLAATFDDDLIRGVVATDALIGTFADLDDSTLVQNRCLLYHLIGRGTGEWLVPVGGMGRVSASLATAARRAGARAITNAEVSAVQADESGVEVSYLGGDGPRTVTARYLVSGVAPATLARLGIDLGRPRPSGSQLKINLVLRRLPKLASGLDPATGFAGTLHIDESAAQLARAYADAAAGRLPDVIPFEAYCHTLTDRSILGESLAGCHTLTIFGLHTPYELFIAAADRTQLRAEAADRVLTGLQRHLAEPLADCLLTDPDGKPCIEVKDPVDIEDSLGMPGGHIFHGDLSWPWADADPGSGGAGGGSGPSRRDPSGHVGSWGAETGYRRVFLAGSGARRGGAVSGLGGHNAAAAVLAADSS